jgi:hypothetical protein
LAFFSVIFGFYSFLRPGINVSEPCEHQSVLTLFNESWLGSAAPKKYLPALNALVTILGGPDSIRFGCTPLLENQKGKNGIDHYEQIKSDIAALSEALDERQPPRLRNVGCDCGTEFIDFDVLDQVSFHGLDVPRRTAFQSRPYTKPSSRYTSVFMSPVCPL